MKRTKKNVAALLVALGASVALGVAFKSCSKASARIKNSTGAPVVVYVAFGADSVVKSFPFCSSTGRLGCKFPLIAGETQDLPLAGKYLNATLSVGGPVTCGITKVELNINNPAWYDIVDISLVDGFSNKMAVTAIDTAGTHDLSVASQSGNEKAFGVYPYGCDLCVERSIPPCDIPKGRDGCKKGPDQYHPDVPCQYQGTTIGGGTSVTITIG
jgi:hypothetical protein